MPDRNPFDRSAPAPGADPADSLRERKRKYLGEEYADDPDGLARYYYHQASARAALSPADLPPFAVWVVGWREGLQERIGGQAE